MRAACGAVPGKLMLAGEYAVLADGGHAVAAAVGTLATWRIDAGDGALRVDAFGQSFAWQLGAVAPAGIATFAQAAVDAAATIGLALDGHLQIDVGGAVAGHKLGLGTSAGVVVAAFAALCAGTGRAFDLDVARAADDAHRRAQGGRGSGYDVFAIAHGGLCRYDRTGRVARALPWPSGLHGVALYAGHGADTRAAIGGAVAPSVEATEAIAGAERALAGALEQTELGAIWAAIGRAEEAFAGLAAASPWLQSAGLARVAAHVRAHHGRYRTSGAGGGDCGLGFFASAAAADAAAAAWQAAGGVVVARLPGDLRPGPGKWPQE